MDRPVSSKFMGHEYEIKWFPKNEITLNPEDTGAPVAIRCFGLTDMEHLTISIEEGMPPTLEKAVLVHEVLHQLCASSGLGLDPELEEKIVTFYGEAIHAHVQSNKSFWRYILRNPK
jgi:hypothetical protein